MILTHLQIQNLRNIESAKLELHSHLNVFFGANGAGKTSLLEALYLLSSGHSFRTREISPLISHQSEALIVFARTNTSETIGIKKSVHAPTQVRINKEICHSSSELAYFLPCQVFYQDIFQIIDAGPSVRRALLDWGMFHVKQNYFPLWKNYKRALKQRNSLLRQRAEQKYLEPWNNILAELGETLHDLRKNYYMILNESFKRELAKLTTLDCSLSYYKGWDKKETEKSLNSILNDSYHLDLQRQYTHYGAHQADLIVEINNHKAKQYLSRGQQKIILFALKLAQVNLLEKNSILLCDDLSSELDEEHIGRLFKSISESKGQFFITTINEDALHSDLYPLKKFRIAAGLIGPGNE